MRKADEFLLAQIRESLLSHIPDEQWALVVEEVDKAGGVREVGGYTGVLLTDAISKASFGGDRSQAGRYAANQRWQGQGKGKGEKGAGAGKYPGARAVVNLPPPAKRSPEEQARIVANVRALQQRPKATDPQSEKRAFDEDDFADKKAFANRKDSETYKKIVESNIGQIERTSGVARYKGSGTDLKTAKEELGRENEMLQAFENKTATTRRLLGGNFKRADARAMIQARIAGAEAKVQALEEYVDRTTPGYNAD